MNWEEYKVHCEAIRNMEMIKENYTIAMYTITFATIGVGIQVENPILLLLPYIVLFPFQRIIYNKNCSIQKLAAFLAVMGEDIWEKNYFKIEDEFKKVYHERPKDEKINFLRKKLGDDKYFKIRDRIMKSQLVRVSAKHLGLVCSVGNVFFLLVCKSNKQPCGNMNFFDGRLLFSDIFIATNFIMAILLFLGMSFWCKHALESKLIRKKYIGAMIRYN